MTDQVMYSKSDELTLLRKALKGSTFRTSMYELLHW